jgi:hypothetical protein
MPVPPIDRKGQKWRCYTVLKTITGQPSGRNHLLKCSKCGAEEYSSWSATSSIFTPKPCDCGDGRKTRIKVGDIRNNKKILKVDVGHRAGRKEYTIEVQCLNCDETDTLNSLYTLTRHKGKNIRYCRFCEWDAVRKDHTGEKHGRWKILTDPGPGVKKRIAVECVKCGKQATFGRNRLHLLKDKKCTGCRTMRREVDDEKVMFVLYREGYGYREIAEYFETNASRVRAVVNDMAVKYESPL